MVCRPQEKMNELELDQHEESVGANVSNNGGVEKTAGEEFQQMQQKLTVAEANNETLIEQIEEMKREVLSQKEMRRNIQKENENLKNQIKEYKNRLENAMTAVSQKERLNYNLQDAVESLKEQTSS